MAATALVFQGPTALPVERSTETRLGLRGTPEQMVKAGMEGFMVNNWLVVNDG